MALASGAEVRGCSTRTSVWVSRGSTSTHTEQRASSTAVEAKREHAEASARGEARRGENAGVADGCKGLACKLHAAAKQTRGEGGARGERERAQRDSLEREREANLGSPHSE